MLKPVAMYGKSREKRPRRRKAQPFTFTCENCGTALRWYVQRQQGVFCEKCWDEIKNIKRGE